MRIASVSLVFLAAVVVTVVFSSKATHRPGELSDTPTPAIRKAASHTERDQREATLPRAAAALTPAAEQATPTNSRPAAKVASQRILGDVRKRIELRAGLGQPIEAQVNNITDYLRGILVGIRAVDPSVLEALRAEYESELCAAESPADVEVLVFTKLAVMQPEIASPRALNCALERRESEDIVTWSLLDAWSATGQAPLSAVAALEQRASDQRTLQRLKTPQQQRAELRSVRASAELGKEGGGR